MENRHNTKKKFFQKLWKKPEILMVLTLQFDKKLLRYITFNLQRLISYCFGVEKTEITLVLLLVV